MKIKLSAAKNQLSVSKLNLTGLRCTFQFLTEMQNRHVQFEIVKPSVSVNIINFPPSCSKTHLFFFWKPQLRSHQPLQQSLLRL